MEKTNTILDREPISSESIRSKQDFSNILKQVGATAKPFYKSAWFYGTIGLSSVAIIATMTILPEEKSKNEENKVVQEPIIEVDNRAEVLTAMNDLEAPVELISIDNGVVDEVKADNQIEQPKNVIQEPIILVEETPNEEIEIKKPIESESKVQIESYGYVSTFPKISGISRGQINIENLCSDNEIKVDGNIVIKSFTISYYNGVEDVEKSIDGNTIPNEVCKEIESHALKTYIRFTNIRGISERGEEFMITNMSLMPTK